jgi:predicted N-acetyltransferase YhbS
METSFNGYKLSDDSKEMDFDAVCALLHNSYWASARPSETIRKSMGQSICFGAWKDGRQVAFARVVSDLATMFWLGDVIVDEAHRGNGLGKALLDFILSSKRFEGMNGILTTKDAHALYEKFGFKRIESLAMGRKNAP